MCHCRVKAKNNIGLKKCSNYILFFNTPSNNYVIIKVINFILPD